MSATHLATSADPVAVALADAPRSFGTWRRSGSDASHKVPVPFSVHWPCRVSPVQPASGRSRFGVAASRFCFAETHRDGSSGGRSPLRFFASTPTADPRPIVLCDGRSFWIAVMSASLATGHASPIFVLDPGDVPLPVRQACHGLAKAAIDGYRTPVESASRRRSWGFALRSIAPARGSSRRFRPDIPTCRLVNQPPRSVFHRGTGRPDLMDLRLDRSNRSS